MAKRPLTFAAGPPSASAVAPANYARARTAPGLAAAIRRREQKSSITRTQSNNLIEARPGKPIRAWVRIVVGDFNHDVHVVLTALRQHRLQPLSVAEDTEVFEALVDDVQRQGHAGAE